MFRLRTLTKSLTLFASLRTNSNINKRSIVDVSRLKGALSAFSAEGEHLSPLHGAVFSHTKGLNRLFSKAETYQTPTATTELLRILFFKSGEEIKPTPNKSNPAYSLTPALLAEVLHHLNQHSLDDENVRDELFNNWHDQHQTDAGSKLTRRKADMLLDLIVQSKAECVNKEIPLHLTETILLSFLYQKATARDDIMQFLNRLNLLDPTLLPTLIPDIEDKFNFRDVKNGKSLITRSSMLSESTKTKFSYYENMLLTLMLMNKQLNYVVSANYGYKNKPKKANCVEVVFHNLCNILLYNSDSAMFDFALLPDRLRPNPKLQEFYAMQDHQGDEVNTSKVGQAFMDILSGNNSFVYFSDRYELDSNVKNFIPVMNFLFGSTATSFQELSAQFSDKRRRVDVNVRGDHVYISLRANGKLENIKVSFANYHAAIDASRFNQLQEEHELDSHFYRLFRSSANELGRNNQSGLSLFSLLSHRSQFTLEKLGMGTFNPPVSVNIANNLATFYSPKDEKEKIALSELLDSTRPRGRQSFYSM